jgi:hypothetical protein
VHICAKAVSEEQTHGGRLQPTTVSLAVAYEGIGSDLAWWIILFLKDCAIDLRSCTESASLEKFCILPGCALSGPLLKCWSETVQLKVNASSFIS